MVTVERVDDLVPGSLPIFLFKTDTQGYELDVLAGAENLLRSNQVFLLLVEFSYGLLTNAGVDPVALLEHIYDLGFVCTYMAYHTRLESPGDMNVYGIVKYFGGADDNSSSVSFDIFVDSLRKIEAPGAAGVSGWTDLLCMQL